MNLKNIVAAALVGASLLFSGAGEPVSAKPTAAQKSFFKKLKKMCGRSFAGATEFPTNADHPLVGKRLLMRVASCTDKEIRIPFEVGADKSRTWVLTLTDKGLLFKHDHRHADGTPDRITNYGGFATTAGTNLLQRFPADEETAKLIPEAATNVWTMQIDEKNQRFMYQLERRNVLRYRGFFSLKPSAPAIVRQ